MYIYIDESGLFKLSENQNQWSCVGALAVPDSALEHLPVIINELKKLHGLSESEEFKRQRPDCTSEGFLSMFQKLKDYGCTYHALVHTGSVGSQEEFDQYKENIITGVTRYAKNVTLPDDSLKNTISLIDKLSPQQLVQCMVQSYMIDGLLKKIIPFYAKYNPVSLGSFFWRIDAKELKETDYDKVFYMLFSGIPGLDKPLPMLVGDDYDYGFLLNSYGVEDLRIEEHIANTKRIFEKDLSSYQKSLIQFKIGNLLRESFLLEDSNSSSGLQICDLITSSLNRCLKLNFDDNEKMASIIGSMIINAPTIHSAITVANFGSSEISIDEKRTELLQNIDKNSINFFGDKFRENYTKYNN